MGAFKVVSSPQYGGRIALYAQRREKTSDTSCQECDEGAELDVT